MSPSILNLPGQRNKQWVELLLRGEFNPLILLVSDAINESRGWRYELRANRIYSECPECLATLALRSTNSTPLSRSSGSMT